MIRARDLRRWRRGEGELLGLIGAATSRTRSQHASWVSTVSTAKRGIICFKLAPPVRRRREKAALHRDRDALRGFRSFRRAALALFWSKFLAVVIARENGPCHP